MSAKFFSRRLGWLSLAIAAVCLAAVLGGTASAALLSYEPFLVGPNPAAGEYAKGTTDGGGGTVGASLSGQDPVIAGGFYGGPWTGSDQVVGQSAEDDQHPNYVGPSLKYPLLPKAGSAVREADHWGNCCSVGRTGRPLASILGSGRNARTIFASFLFDFGGLSGPNQDPNDVGAHDVNNGKRGVEFWNGGVGDGNLSIDFFVNYYSGAPHLTLATRVPNPFEDPNNPNDDFTGQNTLVGPGLSIPELAAFNGGTHLAVLKLEFNPALTDPNASLLDPLDDDTVTVYLDPTSSNEGDWTPAAILSVATSNLQVSHHGAYSEFHFTGAPIRNGAADEFRWGDTFADVTPFIPEPASLTLAGLSVAGMLLSRRRK